MRMKAILRRLFSRENLLALALCPLDISGVLSQEQRATVKSSRKQPVIFAVLRCPRLPSAHDYQTSRAAVTLITWKTDPPVL